MKKAIYFLLFLIMFTFQAKAVDFYVSSTVISPTSGCELTNSETVTIYIGNAGGITTSATYFGISYTVNGVTVSENTSVNAGWAPSATFSYTFATDADLSLCQEHVFDFELTLISDTNPANNTITTSIFSDCAPTLGTVTAPLAVCYGSNSGTVDISGHNGVILDWQYSIDNGVSWNSSGNNSSSQSYSNLTQQTDYWVIIDSPFGYCPADTTPYSTIGIDQLSDGGTLNSDQNVCSNGNSGILNVTGIVGDVVEWEFSIDGGTTWNTLANISDTLLYNDVFTTTQYQVVVQNGTCPSVTSLIAELTVVAGSDAGYITGEDTVCNAEADSLLSLNAFYGNIDNWIYSKDSGTTWIDGGSSATSYSYAVLLGYTIFGVVVTESNCPSDTAFHPIIVLPINVSGGPNLTITEGDTVQLFGTGGINYFWDPSTFMDDQLAQNPRVWPEEDITYHVEVTDQYNCKDTAMVLITVLPDLSDVVIPNLMTPNGDGYNDVWNISNIGAYEESEVHIFDGYGRVIYQSTPYLNDWDAKINGTTIPDGTYFYIVSLGPDFDPLKGALTIVSKK